MESFWRILLSWQCSGAHNCMGDRESYSWVSSISPYMASLTFFFLLPRSCLWSWVSGQRSLLLDSEEESNVLGEVMSDTSGIPASSVPYGAPGKAGTGYPGISTGAPAFPVTPPAERPRVRRAHRALNCLNFLLRVLTAFASAAAFIAMLFAMETVVNPNGQGQKTVEWHSFIGFRYYLLQLMSSDDLCRCDNISLSHTLAPSRILSRLQKWFDKNKEKLDSWDLISLMAWESSHAGGFCWRIQSSARTRYWRQLQPVSLCALDEDPWATRLLHGSPFSSTSYHSQTPTHSAINLIITLCIWMAIVWNASCEVIAIVCILVSCLLRPEAHSYLHRNLFL